jgi:hypothetical protein
MKDWLLISAFAAMLVTSGVLITTLAISKMHSPAVAEFMSVEAGVGPHF